jgi:hypothetical protein
MVSFIRVAGYPRKTIKRNVLLERFVYRPLRNMWRLYSGYTFWLLRQYRRHFSVAWICTLLLLVLSALFVIQGCISPVDGETINIDPRITALDYQVLNTPLGYIRDSSCVLKGYHSPSSGYQDLSGYGNHGTITGATWERLQSGLWVNSFDGTDDIIDCGHAGSLDITTELTIMGWGKINGLTANAKMLAKIDKFYLVYNTAGLQFVILVDGAERSISIADAIESQKWYFVVGTYSSTTKIMYLYRNGIEIGNADLSALSSFTIASDHTYPYYVGGFNTVFHYFKGWIGLARVYNVALSATQIADIFEAEKGLFGITQ